MRIPLLNLFTILAAATVAAACATATPTAGPFYAPGPAPIPRAPGVVIRAEEIGGAPVRAHAWRVLYSSTGLDGAPIAVSGLVIVPGAPAPTRGWDVVAWAHGTTGVATGCAPSLRHDPYEEIPGLADYLSRGYVVTATDYPGLGTAGAHPWLVGVSEARAVLDLVRAAHAMPDAHAGTRFAVWGTSQGGQAALFTGELAAPYAPELALVAVGASAPATDLATSIDAGRSTLVGRTFTAFLIWSWSQVYEAPTDVLVTPKTMATVDKVAAGCIQTAHEIYDVARAASPLGPDFLRTHLNDVSPWRELLARNSPGSAPVAAPLFLAQGSADEIVRPDATAAFAARLCRRGERVRYVIMPGIPHERSAETIAARMVEWMMGRFAGNPAPDDCPRLLAQRKG